MDSYLKNQLPLGRFISVHIFSLYILFQFTFTHSLISHIQTHTHAHTYVCCCLVIKSCLTLCDPMNYSPPGFSIHGISQARTLEWVAVPFFRESYQPRDQTWISCIGRQILYHWATGKSTHMYTYTQSYIHKHTCAHTHVHSLKDLKYWTGGERC